jgi:dGTPase
MQQEKVSDMFLRLYDRLVEDVENARRKAPIFNDHIDVMDTPDMEKTYFKSTPPEIMVVDYLAGMTDDYFINTYVELFFPRQLPFSFRQLERLTGLPRERMIELLRKEV